MKTKDDIINCELVDLYIESLFFLSPCIFSVSMCAMCVVVVRQTISTTTKSARVCQKKLVTH